jgi:hypothetical protein
VACRARGREAGMAHVASVAQELGKGDLNGNQPIGKP